MSTFSVAQEGPVNALALNRDNNQVAIGGRNVFKVYHIEDDKFQEICNLRSSKHLSLGFSCNDVSWCTIDDHYLATAATNGHVCVWNLTKMGKAMQEQDYQDHKRTVNKVNFHATEAYKLISGSQDGTMRYFDIRTKNAVAVFQSNTESVRDVQFSPHNPYVFAAVSDNGSVQLWDVRKPEKYQQQYTAHSGPVFACDWHPETMWLATASRDKTIKVWDLISKPTLEYTIHTMASIGHVKWRPQYKYHIASCAIVIDSSINVWDVRRPYIPFASFNEHRDIASGVAFRGDPNIFLSSGRDSMLYHHSFGDAQRPASKANLHGLTVNSKGEVTQAIKINTAPMVNNGSHSSLTKAVGIKRKTSTSQTADTFHQAVSNMFEFKRSNCKNGDEALTCLGLAKNYLLHGRSVSELCEHNSAVARQFGKDEIANIWKIFKTIYGEEFVQNSINNLNSGGAGDDVATVIETPLGNHERNIGVEPGSEPDQKSKGGDTPGAQFSGGDEETENEDQPDHASANSAFPNYLNVRNGCLPKGDFSFGENELDVELDGVGPDFHNGFQIYNHITPRFSQDWTLPNEAFPVRHEITDQSPPPEQFPNHFHAPDLHEETHTVQYDDQPPGLLTLSKPPKKRIWDSAEIVIDALKHYADLGDTQTSATVLIVLGDSRRYLSATDFRLGREVEVWTRI
ncbi:GATOR complex protein WDR24 isoform X2 [Cylas formicarius]|uniref:GATOR complex protein WDR24 isoform X2 n=1 Tax=Cylas formicarius TaxID=197179 RepID=UPI0029589AB1|nr:GATOR complex protein WDR24 isoform X2 [Cylas formicarius]